jgi:uncharacterized protein (DUF927 family)
MKVEVNDSGTWRTELVKSEDGEEHFQPVRISPPIFIDARTHNSAGEAHGQLVRFKDQDGHEKTCILLYSELACEGKEAIERLFNLGLKASPKRKDLEALRHYILEREPPVTITSVPSHGWHAGTFIHTDQFELGQATDITILDPAVAGGHRYRTAGTIDDWKTNVAAPCNGNTRLVLSLSGGFAAPVLEFVQAPNIGMHLRGISSIGKTTALHVAGSVWGGGPEGFIQSWRATSNGLELACALHNDALLPLDEIGLVNEREIGDIIYCLGNGVGKRRATRDIRSRPVIQFRLVFLSCGERSLHEMMQGSGGKRVKGGQESRLIDIPADPGNGNGIFEHLHQHPNGAALSHCLTQATKRFYGTPSREWTKYLEQNHEAATARAKELRTRFVAKLHLAENQAASELYRIGDAFGLIAAAGQMATEQGLTGWDPAEFLPEYSAGKCFDAWKRERGGYGAHDVMAGLEAVSSFLARFVHRFQCLNEGTQPTTNIHDRAGWYKDDASDDGDRMYYVIRQVFRFEICQDYDYRLVLEELRNHQLLVTNGGTNRLTYDLHVPNEGKNRVYAINSTVSEKW